MKKGILIGAGVVALLAVMIWADHKFPAAGTPGYRLVGGIRVCNANRRANRDAKRSERQGRQPAAV